MQVKLHACMNARSQEQFGRPCGFSGSQAWVMRIAISDTKPTVVKTSTAQKYPSQVISSAGSTPLSL